MAIFPLERYTGTITTDTNISDTATAVLAGLGVHAAGAHQGLQALLRRREVALLQLQPMRGLRRPGGIGVGRHRLLGKAQRRRLVAALQGAQGQAAQAHDRRFRILGEGVVIAFRRGFIAFELRRLSAQGRMELEAERQKAGPSMFASPVLDRKSVV